jgi:DnaK suppressor protein
MTQVNKVDARYDTLMTMLEDRRREIQDRLRSLRESMPVEAAQAADAEEQSVNDFVRDIDWALTQMKAESLAQIDQAILRLREGNYGTCEECEEEISAARLKALPFATLCIRCAENAEEQGAEEQKVQRVPGRVFETQATAAGAEE